jgi:hypothetical protein
MSYAITGGRQYNMVITHPVNDSETVGESGPPMSDILDKMKAYYEGWDPM